MLGEAWWTSWLRWVAACYEWAVESTAGDRIALYGLGATLGTFEAGQRLDD